MSSMIEYRYLAYAFDAQPAFERFRSLNPDFISGYDARMVVVFVEHGPSNCTEMRNGREVLSRHWNLLTVGTHCQAMSDFIAWGGDVEGGMIRRSGTSLKAENYISSWRKRLTDAVPLPLARLTEGMSGGVVEALTYRADPTRLDPHPWVAEKRRRQQLHETDAALTVVITARNDPTDIVCDLVMLSDLVHHRQQHGYPLASLRTRDRRMFEEIHEWNKTRDIFGGNDRVAI
jgi:hypothetical protein